MGQDWAKTGVRMVDPGLSAATAVGRMFTEPDWNQEMENMTSADQVFTPFSGDRGYDTFNNNSVSAPNKHTPVQYDGYANMKNGGSTNNYKEGGTYELNEED
jgi:hypothetical protein